MNANTEATAISLAKQGISKNKLHSILLNCWKIDEKYHPFLEGYFLLKWSGPWTQKVIQNGNGVIVRDGVSYHVVFHAQSPVKIKNAETVLLSFRKATEISTAYVLIKPFLKESTAPLDAVETV